MTEQPIKVVIADDNRFFCEALKDSLVKHEELNVIAHFTTLMELIKFTNNSNLDILILDVNFNGSSSLDVLEKIRPDQSSFKIISLTTLNNNFIKGEALKKGVNAFIGKDSELSEFKDIIVDCHSNFNKKEIEATKKVKIDNLIFTERKLEVLQALYQNSDKKDEDIAQQLNISLSALKTHKRELFEITNTSNTIQLIKFGIEKGLIIS